jgi:hypothetical protein
VGAVGAPRDDSHHPLVAAHRAEQATVGGVPEVERAIVAATDDPCAVGSPRQPPDPGGECCCWPAGSAGVEQQIDAGKRREHGLGQRDEPVGVVGVGQ